MSDLMFNKKKKLKNNTTLFTSASHLMVAGRWGNKARSLQRMWNKVDSPDFHLCKRWQLTLLLLWGAHTRQKAASTVVTNYTWLTPKKKKKSLALITKTSELVFIALVEVLCLLCMRRKTVHFLARLFTEIDFTLSGMLDKQHLGLQLSAHENYCL